MAERLPREREPLPLTLVVARGRALVRQGEPCDAIWIVESGALMSTIVTADGRTLALDVLGSGDIVGEPEGVTSAVTVRALRPCRVRPARRAEAPKLGCDRFATAIASPQRSRSSGVLTSSGRASTRPSSGSSGGSSRRQRSSATAA